MPTKKPAKNRRQSKVQGDTIQHSMTTFLKQNDSILSELMPVSEAAEVRGVNRKSIHELINRGRLHSIELWGRIMVFRSEVMAFEKQKPGPKPE